MTTETAFIALGSNLGDREAHLRYARDRIARLPGTRVLATSPSEETEPLGGAAQPTYLNQMMAIETSLEPHDLLAALHEIESARGRVRREKWASRTLDLDIVVFDALSSTDADLTLPHPGLADRAFWQRQIAMLRSSLGSGR